jgi:hypothetical protein
MRKSSSCVLTVRRFGVCRWAVTALAGAALATLAAWATAMRSPDRPGSVPLPGELAVARDPGSLLLLTLAGPGVRRRLRAVQRRGLEREWQPLRRAVYSPPLVAATTLAANENPPG